LKLIIVSGLSGSGKTVALHTLEDAGYYCIDNLPITMLTGLVTDLLANSQRYRQDVAIGVDVRAGPQELANFPDVVAALQLDQINLRIVFLEADSEVLLQRFSETRRRHPLTLENMPLIDAIESERALLQPVHDAASIVIDTSSLNLHALRRRIHDDVADIKKPLQIEVKSFGFKRGIAEDADIVFDARCLPNPYWQPELRALTGHDEAVQHFLHQQPHTQIMIDQLADFILQWVPCYRAEGRSYLTIAVGCTGGQHRSVYIVEALAKKLASGLKEDILIRHRELT
jgi:UPF0042 nucleotide-binding protein